MDASAGAARPPMLWVGGAQGAGKSTLAWRLARDTDLPLHSVDLWTYDHHARMPPGESMDEQLAQGPEYAAGAFEAHSRLRLGLVLQDIADRGLGDVPAIVEGPQLSPALATDLPTGHGVWLIPDPERTRLAREQRKTSREEVLRRDAILAGRIRAAAAREGWPVIEVPATPDWAAVADGIRSALALGIDASPRLPAGPLLAQQRRYENQVAARQGRLWAEATEMTELPTYPFACECGTSGCAKARVITPAEYEASGLPITH
jgi:hypothetical protein